MSILQEIIKTVEENDWNNLNERLPIIQIEIDILKKELFMNLDNFYLEFAQKPVKLTQQAEKLSNYYIELKSLIENCEQSLKKEIPSMDKYKVSESLLHQGNSTLKICKDVNNCCYIHDKLVDLRFYENDCAKSLQIIEGIWIIMHSADSENITKYFGKHLASIESNFYVHFSEIFNSKFKFGLKDNSSCSYLIVDNNVDIGNVISITLDRSGYIDQLDDLIDFIWEYVIVPIVTYGVVLTINGSELKVKIMKNKEPYYKDVFMRLQNICNFLLDHLNFCICEQENETLLHLIGRQLEDRISPLIRSHCLQNILKNAGDFETRDYENIIQQTKILHASLEKVKLVSNNSIITYAENLEQIRSKKNYDELFETIKTIMSQSYDVVKIGSNGSMDSLSDLPCMSISSVVQEVHQLIEKILLQIKENGKLINVLFDLLHYYRIYSLKDIAAKTPKEIALLHNNFLYSAHELKNWNILFSQIILNDKSVPLFKNQSIIFQTSAEENFEIFMLKEKDKLEKQLIYLDKNNSGELFENCIIECFKLINTLIEPWHDLLAQIVFSKCIGDLINIICRRLIKFVLKLECNDKDMIERISNSFISIIEICEKYSLDEKFINCWIQFKSLSDILKCDIIEIRINKYDLPLKLHFTAFEVEKILRLISEPS